MPYWTWFWILFGLLMGGMVALFIVARQDKATVMALDDAVESFWGGAILAGALAAIVAFPLSWVFPSDAAKAESAAKEVAAADRKRKGFHCLSGWDGSHTRFEHVLKPTLRDPDSYEHIETRVTPRGEDGLHNLRTKFRGANAFGGMVVNSAWAKYDSTCRIREWAME